MEEEEEEAGHLASTPLSRVETSTSSSTTTNMAMPLNTVDMIIMDNGLDLFKNPMNGREEENPHILQMALLLALITRGSRVPIQT